jgi:signal transduction histidine kinase
VRATAELLQTKAHEALTDLRHVLGVLRDDEATPVSDQPQPTFTDLSTLVLEAEEVGMRIQYDDRVVNAAQMPAQIGRTTYRIVQEGLTNVRKHAPGVTALVRVTGSPTDGVSIRISNPARGLTLAAPGATLPRSGLGLVGLTERAMLAGGRLTTRREAGSFELESWLPWN